MHILGIDISEQMLRANAKKIRSFRGVKADLCKSLPVKNNSANTVVVTEVLEHLPDCRILVREIDRILKEGGTVVVSVPYARLPGLWGLIFPLWCKFKWLKDKDEYYLNKCGHVTEFNIKKIINIFNGFSLLERKTLGLMTIFTVFRKNAVPSV